MDGLRIRVLGGLDVEGIDATRLGSRKARSLVKRLVLARGQPVSADQLVDGLWGDRPPARPNDQVAVLVSRLRGVLGADRITRDDAGYRLVADWLDADALAELVDEASRRLVAGETGAARAAATAALALSRGPVLPDELDAEWAEADRARALRLTTQARNVAAEAALAAGDVAAAAEAAGAALDLDPYDEVSLRVQMRALAAAGRPASALAAYARLRERLGEDLGVDPTPETEALHTAILLGEGTTTIPSPDADDASLPGRARELARLDALLAEGGFAVVAGEAGMGKSRLLDVWSSRASAAGPVLRGRCEELARSLPLQAVMDALDLHLRSLEPEAAAALLGAEHEVLAPLLGRVTPASRPVGALVDQASSQALLFGALHAVLGRLGDSPAALIVDDVHFAGPLTIEWLHFLARRGTPANLLVIAAGRPEEGLALPDVETLTLGPLDVEAAAELVGPERAADLHRRSGGHPLFLVELAAAGEEGELPASVREAVASRCDRAGPAADTLRAAAVLGADVDLDVLAASLGKPPVELLGHLEEGARRRLLVDGADGFAFAHELLRDALAADTSASRRALLHRAAGRALASRPRHDPRAVAHHARLGGDDETAAAALVDAATMAAARYDQDEATRLVDEALGLVDSPAGRLARARLRTVAGRHRDAIDDARAANRLGAGAEALELAAWNAHFMKDDDAAVELADEGARLATDPDVQASCLTVGGWSRVTRGEVRSAEAQLERAYALASGSTRTMAATWLGAMRVFQGRSEEGLQLLTPLLTMGIGPWHSQPLTYAHMLRACGLAYQGRATEALAAADDFDEETKRTGSPHFAGRADNIRGWILRQLGETERAFDCNERAREVSESRRLIEALSHAYLDLATGDIALGDLDAAVARLDAADEIQHLPHSLRWRQRLRARLLRARVAMAEHDWATAEAEATGALAVAVEVKADRQQVLAGLLVGQIRLERGDVVDLDELGVLLERLPRVAGLEAWWITADLADAAGVDAWRVMAHHLVAELASRAGPHRASVEAAATRRLS